MTYLVRCELYLHCNCILAARRAYSVVAAGSVPYLASRYVVQGAYRQMAQDCAAEERATDTTESVSSRDEDAFGREASPVQSVYDILSARTARQGWQGRAADMSSTDASVEY